MDYYGLLFLYYLKGLSGKSVLKLFFNIEAGGTEQLLPENTSTPTTTPILADIQYPDGLRTDQYFTYRETPTTVSNKARIKTIKGNTLVWNQLVQNGNFADGTNGWARRYVGTISASNNILTYSYTDSTEISDWQTEVRTPPVNLPANHKVIISYDVKPNGTVGTNQHVADTGNGIVLFDVSPSTIPDGTWTHCAYYGSFNVDIVHFQFRMAGANITNGFTANLKNVQIFDLTKICGSGNEPTTVEEFTSLFSLPYYAYNQGSLLSFNGNGIKTVGKNKFNSEHAISATNVVESNDNGTITIKDVSSLTWSNAYIGYSDVIAGKEYTFKASLKYGRIGGNLSGTSRPVPANQPDTNIGDLIFAAVTSAIPSRTFIPNFTGRIYWWYCTDINNANHQQFTMQPMLSTTDADFEPYTSSTLSLPISTYFPNGMKSAGSVYDELTESKATKRLELFEITSSNIQSNYLDTQNNQWLGHVSIPDIKQIADGTILANIICNTLETKNQGSLFGETGSAIALLVNSTNVRITIRGVTTFADMQTWLDNHETYFVYELATPTETPITTEDANEALSLLMGKTVSSNNANQLIDIITKGE